MTYDNLDLDASIIILGISKAPITSGVGTFIAAPSGMTIGIAIAKTPQDEPVANAISAIVRNTTSGKNTGDIRGSTVAIANCGKPS